MTTIEYYKLDLAAESTKLNVEFTHAHIDVRCFSAGYKPDQTTDSI
jgi:hypothetical protein